MVKKFTLLELHLDDARFTNAIGGTPEEATELLDEIDARDDAMTDMDEMDARSGRSLGRTLAMLGVVAGVAIGIRAILRRVVDVEGELDAVEMDEGAVEVDLDEAIDA